MTNSQTLEALTFDLILEVYEFAARLKATEQLSKSGNHVAAQEQFVAANASSIRIMELSKIIQTVAEKSGRGAFGKSVDSLLQQLPRNLGESTRPQLQAFEEALGLPAGATLYALRTAASTGIETSQAGNLWRIAFTIGLATIAAAGVGAPLAALATNQAIGQKVLEEAVITFASVTIVEAGLVVIMDDTNANRPDQAIKPDEPRGAVRTLDPDDRYLEPISEASDPAGIGTDTSHLAVPQRGDPTRDQTEIERIIARLERLEAAHERTQRDQDRNPTNPWKATAAELGHHPPQGAAQPEQYNPRRPSPGEGRPGPSVGGRR